MFKTQVYQRVYSCLCSRHLHELNVYVKAKYDVVVHSLIHGKLSSLLFWDQSSLIVQQIKAAFYFYVKQKDHCLVYIF